jgi:4'-phosphopantetheinyl transferase
MTTIYYTFCTQLPYNEFRKAVSLLPEGMQQRLGRFKRWQDAHSYLYGRLLLKEGMLQLGYKNSLESMKRNEYGKPYFTNSSFAFNISHSGEYVVCVISTDEQEHLGIDIEKIKPIVFEDFDCVFSSHEKKEIDSYNKFYTYWTRKEAIVKADGRGMIIPLNTIDATKLLVELENDQYYLFKVDIDEKYMLHIASLNKIVKANTVYYSPIINAIEQSKGPILSLT